MSDNALTEFAARVRRHMDAIRAADGETADRLNRELTELIAAAMPQLIADGYPVAAIQDALRDANDVVQQTYAPDDDDDDGGGFTQYLVVCRAMSGQVIADFADGTLDSEGFFDALGADTHTVALEPLTHEVLSQILSGYGGGGDSPLAKVMGGGEIVTDSDGDAVVPALIETEDGVVAEPMVFKSADEVREIARILEPITEKAFAKLFDIKKLIKSGVLDGYDTRDLKKRKDEVCASFLRGFNRLRVFYNAVAAQNLGAVWFTTRASNAG
jgi:hypothetical protein